MEDKINHQDYHTYVYEKNSRDIVLKEFENAQDIATSQSKLFRQFSSVLLALIGLISPFFLKLINVSVESLPAKDILIGFSAGYLFFSYLLVFYFAELQKTIIINARKVVILRQMLGLDYGSLQLVLPNWRVEGASNPTGIKLFPGWFTTISLPFWATIILLNFIFFLVLSPAFPKYWLLVNFFTALFLAFVFRRQLLDNNETVFLLIIKFLSSCLNFKLVNNFENVLYRAKLSAFELDRLDIKYSFIKKSVVSIEDKKFYQHKGVDYKALARSILSIFKFYRKKKNLIKSGGSTINMQLCRTLFIMSEDYDKIIRRKFIEILLALWLDKRISKDLILSIYIASVRYSSNTFGLTEALKYFFGRIEREINLERSLLLVERISAIGSKIKKSRLNYLVNSIENELNESIDKQYLFKIYKQNNIKIID